MFQLNWGSFVALLPKLSLLPIDRPLSAHKFSLNFWYLGIDNMSASELEMVVLCKLEMAQVASQRHHAAMASRIVLMGLKILQSSALFDEKKGHAAAERK